MKLSVVIPAYNEEESLPWVIEELATQLKRADIDHEILVVNDNSSDGTEAVLQRLTLQIAAFHYVNNSPPNGFGLAIQKGLRLYKGDAVAIFMADGSDRPKDLIKYFRTLRATKVDCVFGTRFSRNSRVENYPVHKMMLNRLANTIIRFLFGFAYNDITNAFKLYRRNVIEGIGPILSHHFNLTVELPLKSIVRGYRYEVVPNDWVGRKAGASKLKIKEMGSRYLFIVLYCFIERWLSRGDYRVPVRQVDPLNANA